MQLAPHYFGTANCAGTHCLKKTFFEVFGMRFLVDVLLSLSSDTRPPRPHLIYKGYGVTFEYTGPYPVLSF